jgi:hypothetical protein
MSKENYEYRYVHVAMCPPAVRMYWVCAYRYDQDKEITTHHVPVLAVRTEVIDVYKGTGHSVPGTTEERDERGWRFSDHRVEETVIIYDEEYGIIAANHPLMSDPNQSTELAFCPWPYDEERDKKEIECRAKVAGASLDHKQKEMGSAKGKG